MHTGTMRMLLAVLVALSLALAAGAAEPAKPEALPDLDKLAGQPADLSPWAYAWRADREVQEKPEAYFIPRRLERLDKVYRTVWSRLTETERAKRGYQLYSGLLPAPRDHLLSALLWLAPVPAQRIELRWPEGSAVPPVEAIEVRVYPAVFGWFGFVRDEVLPAPTVSADGRVLTYPTVQSEGSKKGKPIFEGTDMVAVFFDPGRAPAGAKYGCPTIRLVPPLAKWSTLDVEIEWGFQPGAEQAVFDGRIEAYGGYVKSVKPLAEDKGTTMTGAHAWRSATAAGGVRRGIAVSLLYPGRFGSRRLGERPRVSPLDTRITLWTKGGNLTFVLDDVNFGPVLVPGLGMLVAKAGGNKTARQFAAELAAKNLKTIPQMAREHPEAASWEEVMRNVRLPVCPPGEVIPPLVPFAEPPATAMRVALPDERWTDAWRRSSWLLMKGRHVWANLALESAPVLRAADLAGHHETSARRLEHWLKAPGVKPDGDFVDGDGGFEYAKTMKYDIGWSHDGTHPQTGRILFTTAEHFLLTGDKEWFQKNRARMQAAADWILRQRALYLKDIPNRQNLAVAGLQPPQILGDAALGRSWWRWYLIHDAFSLQGLRRFADALAEFDPEAARHYRVEADAYAKDLLRAVEREMAIAPVRPVLDGTYRRVIPASPYARGSMVREIRGIYSLVDLEMGALPLADALGVLEAADPRIGEHLDVIEELLGDNKKTRQQVPGATKEHFWTGVGGHTGYVFVDKIHLRRDDVPCFLRTWENTYAARVNWDGGFGEGKPMGGNTTDALPGSAGMRGDDLIRTAWFFESFRNLLVMEIGDVLWLARATPRAWLEQGKKISVKNAPTHFGTVAYEIVSDVDNGKITATVEMPARKAPKEVILRFRHPKSTPIKGVTVNGKNWTDFNKDKETITLKGLTGTVAVTAQY